MRFLLALIGIAALVVIAAVALGFVTFDTKAGSLPSVSVAPGTAPVVKANVAKLTVGSETKTIEVPTVSLLKPADGNSTANP